uniref:Lipocalin/cytosolic fatty-acid binding domain-containing protein n=1 Tax=Periophthalmus magnuspinnatus TaxID=409849 RepID=A0A3B3ZE41_9GOBI
MENMLLRMLGVLLCALAACAEIAPAADFDLAKKTDTPGRFIFHSHVWNDDNDMRIVEVVYDNYALAHTIKTKNGVQLVLNKLYSRTTQASNDLQQKFRQFSLDTGVLAENILILPPNGKTNVFTLSYY